MSNIWIKENLRKEEAIKAAAAKKSIKSGTRG
jgi:hypothetical protein